MRRLWTTLTCGALLASAFAGGCSSGTGDATADPASQSDAGRDEVEALPVEVATLGRGSISASLNASANLEAECAMQVYARTEGLVRELYVEEGYVVRLGELMLKLEDQDQRNHFLSVQGQLQKARREYQRQQSLFAQQLISEQVFNDATYQIEQLELTLDNARRQLEHTEVRAPIAGRVTARLVNQGARVQPGVHLFNIVDFESLVARIYVPEKELPRLKPGLQARVASQALAGRTFRGRLDRVAPVVDARSGTVKATVAIGAQPGLLPGMYVDVSLITDTHSNVLLVPKRALAYDGEQSFVYRLGQDDRVEKIAVEPVLSDEEFVEPASDTLEPGDRVVVAGQAALKDGARVRVIGEQAPAAAETVGASS
jgi:membrane fusion protein (multidrug efflux system)